MSLAVTIETWLGQLDEIVVSTSFLLSTRPANAALAEPRTDGGATLADVMMVGIAALGTNPEA